MLRQGNGQIRVFAKTRGRQTPNAKRISMWVTDAISPWTAHGIPDPHGTVDILGESLPRPRQGSP